MTEITTTQIRIRIETVRINDFNRPAYHEEWPTALPGQGMPKQPRQYISNFGFR